MPNILSWPSSSVGPHDVDRAAERGHMDGDQATEAECSFANEVGVADNEHATGQGRDDVQVPLVWV